jgi:hypothetical protein
LTHYEYEKQALIGRKLTHYEHEHIVVWKTMCLTMNIKIVLKEMTHHEPEHSLEQELTQHEHEHTVGKEMTNQLQEHSLEKLWLKMSMTIVWKRYDSP